MGRAQRARNRTGKQSNNLKLGQKRSDGKVWAGPDYGFQSPKTFAELKRSGQLALGAGLARRVNQVLDKADQLRDRAFGTADRNSTEGKVIAKIQKAINASPAGTINQGEEALTQGVAEKLGVSPLLVGAV